MDKCKKCGSKNIIHIEYGIGENVYDGISEIDCRDCGVRIGRWSGRVLKGGEEEIRYGGV